MKRVSIVTVTYNCASVIDETLQSIVNQDYSNKQIVVIDGKSRDDTLKRINAYRTCIDVLISEPDKGIFDAMNKSLDYIDGDYVIFINAGDKFVNDQVLSGVFEKYENDDDLIYGDSYVQTKFGYRLRNANPIYVKNASVRDYVFRGQGICHQSLFTKISALRKEGFNLDYPLGADYDTTARVYKNGNRSIHYCGKPVAVFDDREGGASHYKELKVFKERVKMFGYDATLFDYMQIYWKIAKQRVKCKLEAVFPNLVGKLRQRKYSSSI